ncbi:WXG100 family type VII secretion target [Nocardioides campestrisoli]|uniref:WXG100 family type VII secretion target n=1 Tax=Nocardioides campestrisoli TaxID=2736757 RepID=UPI00163D9E30|nr:WXG100 family type VII secretion target [Nocardioides campestrisoli]
MGNEYVFSVDLAELDHLVADVQATETALEQLATDLEAQIRALHQVWEGLAAEAQRVAHQTWEQGMQEMRAALADLRAAARDAHGHYTASAQANTEMWDSLS